MGIFLFLVAIVFITHPTFNLSAESFVYPPEILFSILIGGIIVIYLIKNKKIMYSFYEGLIWVVVYLIEIFQELFKL